jgi:hypothetical protein
MLRHKGKTRVNEFKTCARMVLPLKNMRENGYYDAFPEYIDLLIRCKVICNIIHFLPRIFYRYCLVARDSRTTVRELSCETRQILSKRRDMQLVWPRTKCDTVM